MSSRLCKGFVSEGKSEVCRKVSSGPHQGQHAPELCVCPKVSVRFAQLPLVRSDF